MDDLRKLDGEMASIEKICRECTRSIFGLPGDCPTNCQLKERRARCLAARAALRKLKEGE